MAGGDPVEAGDIPEPRSRPQGLQGDMRSRRDGEHRHEREEDGITVDPSNICNL
jgi:hypothetical protein